MKNPVRHSGLSLMEMIVVVGGISLLVFFGMPAVRMLLRSFETEDGTRSMIQAAFSYARATASKEQRYAGIRFQVRQDPSTPYQGRQYMIFIIHDYDGTYLANGFRAVKGLTPIILPESVGVMNVSNPALVDTMTFSIIFSPTGKLVPHEVRVCNRDDRTAMNSSDDIFNTQANVDGGVGMFIQDAANELSRYGFIMIDRREFDLMDPVEQTDYLAGLDQDQMNYVNAYTGRIIRGGR